MAAGKKTKKLSQCSQLHSGELGHIVSVTTAITILDRWTFLIAILPTTVGHALKQWWTMGRKKGSELHH